MLDPLQETGVAVIGVNNPHLTVLISHLYNQLFFLKKDLSFFSLTQSALSLQPKNVNL